MVCGLSVLYFPALGEISLSVPGYVVCGPSALYFLVVGEIGSSVSGSVVLLFVRVRICGKSRTCLLGIS